MAEQPTESREKWVRGSTLGAGVSLVLALFAMVNYLAERHYVRWDWTSAKLYSLSEKSLAVARGVDRPIDLVVFLSPGSELYDATDELTARYAAANPDFIRKRDVDPAKNLLEARRLVERYSIERENVLVVALKDDSGAVLDRRVIDEFDLAEYDYSGAQFGQPPTLQELKGEAQITSAILELIEAEKPRILFTTGHGEAPLAPGARSLSQARDLLGKDNFEIEEWGSLGQTEVPADTDLLVIAGPTTNFLPPELEVFSRYLDSGGRVLLLLDPVLSAAADGEGLGAPAAIGLEEWLAGYGVEIRPDVVIDPSSELPFFGPETLFTDSYGFHPIVESLQQTRTRVLLPLARSVSQAEVPPEGFEVTELVRTSDAAWGETNLVDIEELAPDDADLTGPVPLGVAVSFRVETEAAAGDPAAGDPAAGDPAGSDGEAPLEDPVPAEDDAGTEDGPEARLVVLGDLDFATDAQLANAANSVLLANAFNWLVQREQLIDIEGRKPQTTKMTVTQSELMSIYLIVMLLMPGLAVAIGVWVWLRRRR